MGSYLYIFLDLISISFPLLASFDKRIAYSTNLRFILPSIFIVGALFIVWDVFFTEWEIWGFNEKYLLGIDLINLPIEEWLFFFCIPYACVFIYESVRYFKGGLIKSFKSKYVTITLALVLLILGFSFWDRAYTATTFLSLGTVLLFLEFFLKVKWLSHFYISYLWVLIPFAIVNGFLTGALIEDQVVWYNDLENMDIRMGTIPVEDTFYGMLLIILNVALFEFFKERAEK